MYYPVLMVASMFIGGAAGMFGLVGPAAGVFALAVIIGAIVVAFQEDAAQAIVGIVVILLLIALVFGIVFLVGWLSGDIKYWDLS